MCRLSWGWQWAKASARWPSGEAKRNSFDVGSRAGESGQLASGETGAAAEFGLAHCSARQPAIQVASQRPSGCGFVEDLRFRLGQVVREPSRSARQARAIEREGRDVA